MIMMMVLMVMKMVKMMFVVVVINTILLIPLTGSMWMNWTLTATVAACVPLWLLLRADYNRLTVDEAIPTLDAISTEVVVVVHPGQDTSVVEAAKSIN